MLNLNNRGTKLTFDERGVKVMAALTVLVGVIGFAAIIGEAISDLRGGARFVTVRGVAEKEVKADLAIWPIRIRVVGNNLLQASQQADVARKKVLTFLSANDIAASDIASQDLRVQDRETKDYAQTKVPFRYLVEYTVLLRSAEVEKIKRISQMTNQLVNAGVILSSQGTWDRNAPRFLFTQLNAIKPEMMSSATKAAREVATQFASDSNTQLGPILRATQGLFTITDRDVGSTQGGASSESDINKKVRVVVKLDYFLQS